MIVIEKRTAGTGTKKTRIDLNLMPAGLEVPRSLQIEIERKLPDECDKEEE